MGGSPPVLAQSAAKVSANVPQTAPRSPGPVWVLGGERMLPGGTSRPVQGIRGPHIQADGKRVVFTAVGDLWVADIDEKNLAQGKRPKARHLIKDEALDTDPVWSPDGTQLAFVSDRGGKPDIWLRDMKTNKFRQLTTLDDAVAMPSWSPDGKRIAFFKIPPFGRTDQRSLNVVTVFTGDVAEIRNPIGTEGAIAWSADGKTLAMKVMNAPSPKGGTAAGFMFISLTGTPDRYMVPEGGVVLSAPRGRGPAWSPDGSKLAYVSNGMLYVVPVVGTGAKAGEATGAPRLLVRDMVDSPSWTGDSKSIVYTTADGLKQTTLDGATRSLQPDLTWRPNTPEGTMVVWAGRLWDGIAGGYRTDVDIVIEGNVITAVEPHQARDAKVHVVNASKKTVIPGLIDARARLSAAPGERLGRMLLSHGITTVNEWGNDIYDALERRESWAGGRRYGPRVFSTIMLPSVPVLEARVGLEATRRTRLLYHVASENTRLPEIIPEDMAIKLMSFGMRGGDKGTSAHGPGVVTFPNLSRDDGFIAFALRNPAVLAQRQEADLYTDYEIDALKALVEGHRANLAALERTVSAAQNGLRAMAARGEQIALGSSSPVVPYGLGFQVECMLAQASGLPARQVLELATSGNAKTIGVDAKIGTVAPGKLADLAIIDGDPLANVADLAAVAGVVADGHYYIIDELLRH
jgi:hypothetical protein